MRAFVRLPSISFQQVEILCNVVKHVLQGMETARNFICLVHYGHENGINDAFSSICDICVVWGGDRKIHELRRLMLKARASEIVFADRYFIAVIDADAYLELKNKERVARDFYHDTYLTDQNECVSPRLVIWPVKERNVARETFWKTLRDVIDKEHYELRSVQAVDKLTRLCLLSARKPSRRQEEQENVIVRAMLETLNSDVMSCMGNSGFFLEYDAKIWMSFCRSAGNGARQFPIAGTSENR